MQSGFRNRKKQYVGQIDRPTRTGQNVSQLVCVKNNVIMSHCDGETQRRRDRERSQDVRKKRARVKILGCVCIVECVVLLPACAVHTEKYSSSYCGTGSPLRCLFLQHHVRNRLTGKNHAISSATKDSRIGDILYSSAAACIRFKEPGPRLCATAG